MEVMVEPGGREERWLKHYSSQHNILLVGDGDFSFSLCLARAFGSATNIVATSLDSYDELKNKYKYARINVAKLKALGASVLHGVDATRMRRILPRLPENKFHRIIYNFPHAGFHGKEDHPDLIRMHRNLVRGFLTSASSMLFPDGEIHVNHKTTAPFNAWRIEDLASECSLLFVGQDVFRIEDYPGYRNKRGAGSRSDEAFPLGECCTFKFKLHPVAENSSANKLSLNLIPVCLQRQPPVNPPSPFNDYKLLLNEQTCDGNECLRIFGRYLNHMEETFGSTLYDVGNSVREALKDGFETYMAAAPSRETSGYIGVLEELHRLSIERSGKLRQMLLLLDQQY